MHRGHILNAENFDKFRGRVIFPIKDIAGRVIAFGGRIIDGEGIKYINSSESEIYSKRRNLYLLDIARKSIRQKKRSILVEGYMDAVRLHKCGFSETVASLGTSLTQEQAELLSRFADRCYLCYDSDKAGQKAAIQSMFTLQKHGLDVYVVNLPASKDPDEFLTSNPAQAFEEALTKARPLVVYYVDAMRAAVNDTLTRKTAMKDLFMTLSELEVHEVLAHKAHISEATGIPPSKIEDWFISHKPEMPEDAPAPAEIKGAEHQSEAAMCSLLYHYVECRLSIRPEEIIAFMRNPGARDTALALLNANPDDLDLSWTQLQDTEHMAVIARGDEYCAQMKGLSVTEKFRNTYIILRERNKAWRVRELTAKMQKSEATPEELSELTILKR